MKAPRWLFITAGLAVALASGCVLSVEGNLPEIEVVQRGLSIPGVPREARASEPTAGVASFFQPNDHLGLEPETYASVHVKEVVLSAKSGVDDLSFIHSLRIGMNGLQGFVAGTAPVEVAHYQRSATAGPPVGPTITMRNSQPVPVIEAWRDSMAVLTLQAQGDLPETAWTVDIIVRLSAVLKY